MVLSFIAAVIAFGILVFIHEAGHFLMARRLGVGVEKFSLGFGPKIISKKVDDTEYILSAVPLGGYVKLIGEDPNEENIDPEKSFSAQPVWKRFSIVFAGPLFNMILPVLIFTISFMVGFETLGTKVGKVIDDSPALSAGLIKGDKIIAIDARSITKWDELKDIVSKSPDKLLEFTIIRNGSKEATVLKIKPKAETFTDIFGDTHTEGRIGIIPGDDTVLERYNPLMAVYKGVERSWLITKLMALSIKKLIEGAVPADSIGGPILIAQMAGQQAKQGIRSFFNFIALLSINLGLLNLLPVPVLDGGHIFFFFIEAVSGSPVSEKKIEIAQQVGLFMLISLMVFAFYNDIMRFFL